MIGIMNRLDREIALSAKLDELIEFSPLSDILEKLGTSSGETAQAGLDKLAASKGWGTRGLSTPVGGASIGSYLNKFNAPAVTGATATAPSNVAQKVAQQAGQNVAAQTAAQTAGAQAVEQGKKKSLLSKYGTTGAGVLIGGAMATPDWALKQNNQSMSAWIDDIINFADPRPRNPLGEFTGQEGGPDANAMAAVYKMPQPQPQQGIGIPKLAGAALVGGALGQIGGNIGKEGWQGMTKLVKHLHKQVKIRK